MLKPLPQQLWRLKRLQSKTLLLSTGPLWCGGVRGFPTMNWIGCGVSCLCICVCVRAHMFECLHTHVHPPAHLKDSKPPGVSKVCPKPPLTAASVLWPFPREAWSFIYNKSQPRPSGQGGRPRSCGWASLKAAGPHLPPKVFQEC